MWIRTEEDLRRHLDDPTSREGHAFEYKGAIDNDPRKGRGADFASSVASLANADGGQVLLGVRDKDGAPGKVVDVGKLEAVGKDIEDTVSKFLVGIEPRPTWQPFDYEGSTVIVVDVLPSVRLVAYWSPGEREKIMYPVRTGDRLAYMRPGDVEARILSYGPRATRIMLEHLMRQAEDDRVAFRVCTQSAQNRSVHVWGNGEVRVAALEEFGLRLHFSGRTCKGKAIEDPDLWVPYEWVTAHLERSPEANGPGPERLALLLKAWINRDTPHLQIQPLAP